MGRSLPHITTIAPLPAAGALCASHTGAAGSRPFCPLHTASGGDTIGKSFGWGCLPMLHNRLPAQIVLQMQKCMLASPIVPLLWSASARSTNIIFLLPQKNNIRIQRSQAMRVFRAAALKRFWNLGSPQGLATLWGEEDAPQRRGLPAA